MALPWGCGMLERLKRYTVMTRAYVAIDISNAPELQRLAEAVRQSGKPHALQAGAETIAVVHPAPKQARGAGSSPRPSRRSRVFTKDDPLWNIVGMFDDPEGPTDVSSNKHAYLAEAYMPKTE